MTEVPQIKGRALTLPAAPYSYAVAVFGLSILLKLIHAFRDDNPLVIYDELSYLLLGKELNNISVVHDLAPNVPQFNNFLYLRILHVIHDLGLPVDTGVKLFNVFCIGFANWLLIQRLLSNDRRFVVLMAVALICFFPTVTYAAYVMPEAVYSFGFVLVCQRFFSDFDPCSAKQLLPVALLLAALTLVKPHAIMIFGSLIGSLIVFCACFDRSRARQYVIAIAVLTIAFGLTTLALKRLLTPASSANYDVVGTFYWGFILHSIPTFERFREFLSTFALYLPLLGTLYAPLLALSVKEIVRRRPLVLMPGQRNIVFFLLFLLISLLVVMTAVVYLLSSEVNRAHFRYFGFVFPVLVTLLWICQSAQRGLHSTTTAVAIGLWLVSIAAASLSLSHYRPLAIDAPELFAFYGQEEFGAFAPWWLRFALLGFLAAVSLGLLRRRLRLIDVQVVALCVVSATALWNVVGSQTAMTNSPTVSGFRRIGRVAALMCGKGYDGIVLIGQANVFVPLAYSLYELGQASRFEIVEPGEISNAIERVPASTCLLTTFKVPNEKAVLLFAVPALWLYRTNG